MCRERNRLGTFLFGIAHPAMENVTQLLVAMQALSADMRTSQAQMSNEMQVRVSSATQRAPLRG